MYNICSHGVATWAELSTPDTTAAMDFYGDLLGWHFEARSTPTGEDWVGSADGFEIAGLRRVEPERHHPTAWTVFFDVVSVEEAVEAVEEAGGSVLDVPFGLPGGRAATVADPTGATLGLVSWDRRWTWLSTSPGAVRWVELLTRDPATAEPFYTAVLGWKALTTNHSGRPYTTFVCAGIFVAGAMPMPDEVPAGAPANWSVSFAVEDCAAAERRAEQLGGSVLRPTTDLGAGRFAVLADPTGATFQLLEAVT